jgi:hypothetical protein
VKYRGLHSNVINMIMPYLKESGWLPEVAFLIPSYQYGRYWLDENAEIICALGSSRAMTSGSAFCPPRTFIVRYLDRYYEVDLVVEARKMYGVKYDFLLADRSELQIRHLIPYAERAVLRNHYTSLNSAGSKIKPSDIYLPFTERQAEALVGDYAL